MVRARRRCNERVTTQVDEMLRANFADGDGRLPRTLEAFLGDRGQLRTFTRDLFDEERRDSAIGRMRLLLGSYFDGDASRLAQLLDPTRLGSPLHQFRTEVARGFEQLNERLTAIEAAATARASERRALDRQGRGLRGRSSRTCWPDALRGTDHLLERTADAAGDVLRSRKGDFVITLDPETVHGATPAGRRRVQGPHHLRARHAGGARRRRRRNRDAAVALVVFSTTHAPAGIAPFDVRMGDVYCVIDPEAPGASHAGGRAAPGPTRWPSARSARPAGHRRRRAVREALARIGPELDALRALKTRLTTIGTASAAPSTPAWTSCETPSWHASRRRRPPSPARPRIVAAAA